MARKRRQPAKAEALVLHLDGRVSARQFRQAVGAFVDFIEAVTVETAGSADAIRWIMSVHDGSINLAACPESLARRAPIKKVVQSVSRGVHLLAHRAQRPAHFTTRALRRLRALAAIVDGQEVTAAEIGTPSDSDNNVARELYKLEGTFFKRSDHPRKVQQLSLR